MPGPGRALVVLPCPALWQCHVEQCGTRVTAPGTRKALFCRFCHPVPTHPPLALLRLGSGSGSRAVLHSPSGVCMLPLSSFSPGTPKMHFVFHPGAFFCLLSALGVLLQGPGKVVCCRVKGTGVFSTLLLPRPPSLRHSSCSWQTAHPSVNTRRLAALGSPLLSPLPSESLLSSPLPLDPSSTLISSLQISLAFLQGSKRAVQGLWMRGWSDRTRTGLKLRIGLDGMLKRNSSPGGW